MLMTSLQPLLVLQHTDASCNMSEIGKVPAQLFRPT